MAAYLEVLKKYATFSGRAGRQEYWTFVLVNVAIAFLLGAIEGMADIAPESNGSVLGLIFTLAILVPSLAVSVRRLHDIGRTGWWMLFGIVPIIGSLTLLVFALLESQSGDNQYGTHPSTA